MRDGSVHKVMVLCGVVVLVAGVMLVDTVAAAAEDDSPGGEWTRQFDGGGDGVSVDASGIYVIGSSRGSSQVRKFDRAGNEEWTRPFGPDGDDYVEGAAAGDSGVYVVGSTGGMSWAAVVRKYDEAGNEVWADVVDTEGDEHFEAAAVDDSGVYVVGSMAQLYADYDVSVVKYDSGGSVAWSSLFGSDDEWDGAEAVAVDATGVYVTGWTWGVLPGQTSAGEADVFVARYDLDGDEVWTRQFGTTENDGVSGVAVDGSGVYVTGVTHGLLPDQTGVGETDAFLRKYDLDGNEVWTRQFGTTAYDEGRGVAVDASGVYVTGSTFGSLPGQSNAGGWDVFVRRYDPAGNDVWTRQFGTSWWAESSGVAVDDTGIYLAGSTDVGAFGGFVGRYQEDTPTCLGWAVTMAGTAAADTLVGTWRDDVIDARGGDDTVYGQGGNDIICGGDGNDLLYGGPGTDQLDGREGADTLSGGDHDDNLLGGNGDDVVSGNTGSDTLRGGDGTDILRGWTGADRLYGGNDDDLLYGGPDDDQLKGEDGADTLSGGDHDDILEGWTGDDTLSGNQGHDTLSGHAGNDILRGWTGRDELEGGLGDDLLYGGPDDDQLYGEDGADTLSGGDHDDILKGWTGDDLLAGDQGNDTLYGGDGSDILRGWGGNDVLYGGADNDLLYGSDDDDTLYGEDGDDSLYGGDGIDFLDGGPDINRCWNGETNLRCENAGVPPPSVEWTRQFGTSEGDYGSGVAVDATGIYLTGGTYGALPGQTNAGDRDVFVRGYDPDGTERWTRQFGTTGTDGGMAVDVDTSGVYLVGDTFGTLPGQTHAGEYDVFVRRYDTDGTEQWTRQFGTEGFDVGNGVAVDATGIYVVGDTFGALPGQTQAGERDVFVRRYDTDGNEQWTLQFGTKDADWGNGVAVDTTGVYVAGWTHGALPGQTQAGDGDAFVRKYDHDGNELWTRQFGGIRQDRGNAVAVNATGVYVTGTLFRDVYVRRYDHDGTELWTHEFGTIHQDHSNGVAVDGSGVYVVGGTGLALPGETNAGERDLFVRKYDHEGFQQWTRQFGTTEWDGGGGVAVDTTGIYLTGDTNGAFPGQTNAGSSDAFLRRYDENTAQCLDAPVTIAGTESADTLEGTPHDDVIDTRGGDDIAYGQGGNDIICGGDGNDYLDGGPGTDDLDGGEGTDECTEGETYVGCELIL